MREAIGARADSGARGRADERDPALATAPAAVGPPRGRALPPWGAPPEEHDTPEWRDARHRSAAAPIAPPRLPPILCYHKVDPRLELGVTRISPRRFARQIERLARAGWRTVTLAELLACARGTRAVGARELAITFDDGYRALRDHAFPVLAAHGFGAVCSIITDYAGKLNRWDVAYGGRRFAHLAWRDARRWRDRGIEFVSHTASHPRLTWLDDLSVARELARSREAMARELGEGGDVISWPFGAARRREFEIARAEGYRAGLTLATRWRGDPMAVPRLPVYPWSPPTPGVGPLRHLEWLGAIGANRCAIGTTLLRALPARR